MRRSASDISSGSGFGDSISLYYRKQKNLRFSTPVLGSGTHSSNFGVKKHSPGPIVESPVTTSWVISVNVEDGRSGEKILTTPDCGSKLVFHSSGGRGTERESLITSSPSTKTLPLLYSGNLCWFLTNVCTGRTGSVLSVTTVPLRRVLDP